MPVDLYFFYTHPISDLNQRIILIFMVLAAIWCIHILCRYREDLRDWRERRVEGVRIIIACYWLSLIPIGGWLIINLFRLGSR